MFGVDTESSKSNTWNVKSMFRGPTVVGRGLKNMYKVCGDPVHFIPLHTYSFT